MGEATSDRDKYKIFIGGLSFAATSDDVYEAFREAGKIIDVNVVTDADGKSKGYGFVSFDTEKSFQYAMDRLSAISIRGRTVNLSQARSMEQRAAGRAGGDTAAAADRGGGGSGRAALPRNYDTDAGDARAFGGARSKGCRLTVYNLPDTYTWRELKDFLRHNTGSQPTYANVERPGLGVGEFATTSERDNAVRVLDGMSLNDHKLRCDPQDMDGGRAPDLTASTYTTANYGRSDRGERGAGGYSSSRDDRGGGGRSSYGYERPPDYDDRGGRSGGGGGDRYAPPAAAAAPRSSSGYGRGYEDAGRGGYERNSAGYDDRGGGRGADKYAGAPSGSRADYGAPRSSGYDAGRYEGSGGGRYGDDGGAAYRDPGYSSRDAALYGAAAAPRERAYDARDPYYAAGAAGGGSAARSDPRGGYPPSSREAAPYSSSYGASGGGGYGYAPRDEYDDRGGGAPRSDRYAAAAAPVASRGDYPPSGSGRAPSGYEGGGSRYEEPAASYREASYGSQYYAKDPGSGSGYPATSGAPPRDRAYEGSAYGSSRGGGRDPAAGAAPYPERGGRSGYPDAAAAYEGSGRGGPERHQYGGSSAGRERSGPYY